MSAKKVTSAKQVTSAKKMASTTKAEKEIPLYHDTGFFKHETGDTYDGSFEIKKKDMSLKMNGAGIYTTAEGDAYICNWENDVPSRNEPVKIQFHDGADYNGYFKDWCYNGQGKYTYPDNAELRCEFLNNCPQGNLTLIDPNGHEWLAKADIGFAWFEPVNHYYKMLESTFESDKHRRRRLLKEGFTLSENWVPNATLATIPRNQY